MKRILSLLLLPGLLLPGLLTGCGEKEPDLYPLVGQTVEEALAELEIDPAELPEENYPELTILPGTYSWKGQEWEVTLGHDMETMEIYHIIYRQTDLGVGDLEKIRALYDELYKEYGGVSKNSTNSMAERLLDQYEALEGVENMQVGAIFVKDGRQIDMTFMWIPEEPRGILECSLHPEIDYSQIVPS